MDALKDLLKDYEYLDLKATNFKSPISIGILTKHGDFIDSFFLVLKTIFNDFNSIDISSVVHILTSIGRPIMYSMSININDQTIPFFYSPVNQHPYAHHNYTFLFQKLSLADIVLIYECIM